MKNVMRWSVLLLSVTVMSGTVSATDFATKTYGGGGQGKVLFNGKLHAMKGKVCKDCHDHPFNPRKKEKITMDDHLEYKKCFACHDGENYFKDCARCHGNN